MAIGYIHSLNDKSPYYAYIAVNLHAAFALNAGDEIRLRLVNGSISSDDMLDSQFIGWLVEQDLT